MGLWVVIINGGVLALGVVAVVYEHGRSRGTIEQIDRRLERIEDFLFNGKRSG